MSLTFERRRFLQAAGAAAGLAGLGAVPLQALADPASHAAPHAEKLGWRLGCLFNCFTPPILNDAVDQVHSLGLGYLEGGSRPTIRAEMPKEHLDPTTPPEVLKTFRDRLAGARVKMASYYTYRRAPVEAEWAAEFAFAKAMGIEILVGEPDPEAFDLVEKLCDRNQIALAVHNHPAPSHYSSDEAVLAVCRNRGPRIGACPDTGHWVRSGIDPVEALKRLEGRIVSVHLKDMDRAALKAKQVAWGTGVGNVKGVLKEIHRQKAKPLFIMEYERPVARAEIVECIGYFDQVAAELLSQS